MHSAGRVGEASWSWAKHSAGRQLFRWELGEAQRAGMCNTHRAAEVHAAPELVPFRLDQPIEKLFGGKGRHLP